MYTVQYTIQQTSETFKSFDSTGQGTDKESVAGVTTIIGQFLRTETGSLAPNPEFVSTKEIARRLTCDRETDHNLATGKRSAAK